MKLDSLIRIAIVIAFAIVMTKLLAMATVDRDQYDRVEKSVESLVYLDVMFEHELVRLHAGLEVDKELAFGRLNAMERVGRTLIDHVDRSIEDRQALNRAVFDLYQQVQKKSIYWQQFSDALSTGQRQMAEDSLKRLIGLPMYQLAVDVRQVLQTLIEQQDKEAAWNRFLLYFSAMVILSLLFYLMYLHHRAERQQQRMMRAVEATADALVLTDAEGVIEYINPAFTALSGWQRGEVVGKKHGRFDDTQTGEQREKWLKALKRGKEWRETVLKRKKPKNDAAEGIPYWCRETIAPVLDPHGRPDGYVHVHHDITELKEIQGQLQTAKQMADAANQAKSDFLANMSHEIRTPMNAIMGMTELCMHTNTTPKQRDYLEKIDAASRSLLRIINDILDFSKIEVNRLEMERIPFNLEQVLNSLIAIVSLRAQEKGLELLIKTDPALPMMLVGDPVRLEQVLINLANNAVKFTTTGEVLVTADLLEREDGDVTIRFSVRDTGIGMNGEQIGRLFQTFSQGDASTTRKYGGTGLGLAISKRLVQMMGGDIEVQSVVGEGSVFTFTADFGLAAAEEATAKPLVPSVDLKGMPVLVIDDNRSSLDIMKQMLESFSFEAVTALSGPEGLKALLAAERARHPFKLVITDWRMPEMNGLETAVTILGHTELSRIPKVIMMTAFDDKQVRQQAANCHLDGFLAKPISQSVLFDAIMKVFGEEGDETVERLRRKKRVNRLGKTLAAIPGTTVLLVEDNEVNQQVARELLELANFSVTVAGDGAQALTALAKDRFDVVLMDLQMPVMDGHESTRHIRQNPEYDQTPIIAMTADALSGEKERCLASGMNDFVVKPIDVEALFSTLDRWIPEKLVVRRTMVAGDDAGLAAAEAPLPELPGVDVQSGLRKLGGNREIYEGLLLKFSENHGRAGAEVREMLAAGRTAEAKRLIHSVKGLAGNVGATDLQSTGEALEAALQLADDSLVATHLDRFEALVDSVAKAITASARNRSERPAAGGESVKTPPKPVDTAALLKGLREMEPHVRKRKPRLCQPILETLTAAAWPPELFEEMRSLDQFIRKYKFNEAKAMHAKLIAALEGREHA